MPDTRARVTAAAWKLTGGVSWLAPGLVTGGTPGIEDPWETNDGVGAVAINHAGDIDLAPSLEAEATIDTFDLFDHATRATYPRGVQTGMDDAATSLAFMCSTDLANSYTMGLGALNRARLSWSGETVKATFDFIFLTLGAPAAAIAMVAPARAVKLTASHLTVNRGGADCDCVGFDVEVNNNARAVALGNGRSASAMRQKDSIEQGLEDVSLTLRVRIPEAVTVGADTLVAPATDITIVALENAVTKTLTFTNVALRGPGYPLRQREDGYVIYEQRYFCPRGCLVQS